MTENEITSKIIGASIEVHKQLGPGLLESTYETCLGYELRVMGLFVKHQIALPVIYKEVKLEAGYRIDMVVENKVIIEVKSVDALAEIHTAQLLTYLKLTNLKLGLLINYFIYALWESCRSAFSLCCVISIPPFICHFGYNSHFVLLNLL